MPDSNEIRPIGNALNNDVREGIGARGGVGLGGAWSAEANAEVDGSEDEVEPECTEEDEGVGSNGIGSRLPPIDAVRGSVRDLDIVSDENAGVADDGGKKDNWDKGTRRIVRVDELESMGVRSSPLEGGGMGLSGSVWIVLPPVDSSWERTSSFAL